MNNEFEEALKEYNSRIVSEEEIEKQLKEQNEFIHTMGHVLDEELSLEDIQKLDVSTQQKLAHIDLKDRQHIELIDLDV